MGRRRKYIGYFRGEVEFVKRTEWVNVESDCAM